MVMFGLNEAMDLLTTANSVCWYCHVLRREDDHVLRMALDCRLKVNGVNGGRRRLGRSRLRSKI